MKKIVISSFIVLGLSTAAFAQVATDFTSVDTDVSGGVSLAEAQFAWPEITAEVFAAADLDVSGELSADEYVAVVSAAAVPAS
jgi:hypothetical protein